MAIQRSTLVTKAQELMNTEGLDGASAAKKARELMTANVAPIAPVATPPVNTSPISPTTNVNQAQREANIASRQATPAPITTPAPVVPTVETPKPVEASVTPTTPTQTPFQQAQAESEKIKAQNEAQMKLNTQQADLKAQERQQVAQETARANTPTNQKDVLNALVSGVSVAPQNTPAYRNAQMQYKTYQKFATMTPTQLVDNMKMGEIGTETAQLLASNPNYIKAKEDFDKFQKNQSINNMIKSVAEGATGKTTTVDHYQNASDAIAKKLGITETNADAFARIVSKDPETLQLTKTVSNIAKQLNTLNTERNAVYEDLKKQYPDLSASAIMTLMAGRTKEATAQIDALNSSLTLTQADLKMAMEMAKAEYDATKEDITLQAGLAKEDRAMQQALDLSQAQFDQKLAQQAQLTNDPTTAITTMIDEYKKLGIPFTSTVQSRLAEFKASGKTLPQFLTEMGQNIQQSPAYQKYQALQQGQMSDVQKMDAQNAFDLKKMAQQNNFDMQKLGVQLQASGWTKDASGNLVNPVTGQTFNGSISRASATGNIVPVTVGGKTVRLDQSGSTGFESAVNQATTAGTPLVFRDGVAGVRDQVATIKEMADKNGIPFNANNPAETAAKIRAKGIPVADPGKSNHESGMAIDVYGDSKLGKVSPAQEKILNANGWYSANIPGDAGHFEYKGQGSLNTSTTGNFSQKAIDLGQNILSGDAKLSDISGKSNEALKVEVMQYIANKNKTTQNTNVSQIQDTIKLIDSITNHPGLTSAVGAKSLFTNPLDYSLPSSDAAGFKAKLEQLTAANFMVGIKSMKGLGALSDAEGSKVSASVSSLANRDQGEAEYKAELQRLRDVLTNRLTSTEKETGIKYDANGFAIDPTQQQSNTAPVAVQDILIEWNNRK